MAGGATAAIIGGSQVNVFDDNGGSGGVAFVAGLAMFGTGVVFTILGVRERSKSKNEPAQESSLHDRGKMQSNTPLFESQFYVGPAKRGASAGICFRW
jgi:hypothetical protein